MNGLWLSTTTTTSFNRWVVNAFQVASRVLFQKSTRERFGLTVTEAMWKGKPMIGGNVGGIRIQIEDGLSGYLVDSPEECAWRTVKLFGDSDKMLKMGNLRARPATVLIAPVSVGLFERGPCWEGSGKQQKGS